MPFPKQTQLTSWSYSRYGTYDQCPLKAKLSYIDKLPQEKGPAMERGAEIHTLAENYLKGVTSRLPKELAKFGDELKMIRALAKKKPHLVNIEDTWALRSDWTPTVWNDWQGCWLRIKLDVAYIATGDQGQPIAHVIDFKTGSFRRDNQDSYLVQLELYALGALIKWQDLAGLEVRPELMYLDAGIRFPYPESLTASDLPRLKKEWQKRVKPMLADKRFAPKPNRFCGWCDWNAQKGGPCKY
jgi:RecB family exonuclease